MPKCKYCKEPTTQRYGLTYACSIDHAILAGRAKALQREKKEIREARKRIKTRQEWLKEVEAVFNKWVRLRDADLPCVSCGRFHHGQYHASHYRSVAAAGHLRYTPDNVHKACKPCNKDLSGNLLEYRKRLIVKIGLDRVTALENDNRTHKWEIAELIDLKKVYSAKVRELEKEML